MKSALDDATLVAQCKRELPYQHKAFEQLVERYKHMAFTLCLRMVGRASVAEELTQEVFTKVFLNLSSFEERSQFSSWVYRIAYNHSLNFLSRQKREQQGMADYAEELEPARSDQGGSKLSDQMRRALNGMNEEQRSILIMKYVIELELKEIGEILNVSTGAVKMRLLRAREEFRRLYQGPDLAGE